jgi:hypothetical protein
MSRLDDNRRAAMDRNRTALLMSCVAHETNQNDNAQAARHAEHWLNREAQFDIEGAIDWRHAQPKWGHG